MTAPAVDVDRGKQIVPIAKQKIAPPLTLVKWKQWLNNRPLKVRILHYNSLTLT